MKTLHDLVTKWRREANDCAKAGIDAIGATLSTCADELEQAIQRPTIKRPTMRTAPVAINCRGDGNQICALIGSDLHDGVAGFGDTLADALRSLADEIEKEVIPSTY